jgi:HEAT repeat protein
MSAANGKIKSLKKVILIFILLISVSGCGGSKSEKAVAPLIKAAKDKDPRIRKAVINVLGEIYSKVN